MLKEVFEEYKGLGITVIPITWVNGAPKSHGLWKDKDEFDLQQDHNGIMIRAENYLAFIDCDIKNCTDKTIFDKWLHIVKNENESILSKVFIESTRSGGYHVWFKYKQLPGKVNLASNEAGNEVFALYSKGVLGYTWPTEGYNCVQNSMSEIEYLNQNEYDLLISAAAYFNEYTQPEYDSSPFIEYPQQYESACLTFDHDITDEAFEQLLNDMTLYEVPDFRYNSRQKFKAYKRKGSTANYSAKVYFGSRKVLLFTTSLQGFPSWADKRSAEDRSWVLTPARILYYRNGKDWINTMAEMQVIADSIGITLKHTPVAETPITHDRMQFPYDIFPEIMQEYIRSHRIQHEYIAGFMLPAIATAIGNTCYLEPFEGYKLRPSVYLAVVAFPGGGKSPAMKVAFDYLQRYDQDGFMEHKGRLAAYNEELASYEKNRKGTTKPSRPILSQVLVNDATMETVINVLQYNQKGCCLVADELAGFMKRMTQYKDGDDSQKWLEMWDSSPVMQQRITADERKIFDYTMSIAGGIQPGVINSLAKGDNAFNGFYHRFLFVFPEADEKMPFAPIERPAHLKAEIDTIFERLMIYRSSDVKDRYTLSYAALKLYKQWHDYKNLYYNRTADENAKGIIAKYQAYCLRFALVLQCLDDLDKRTGTVTQSAMERAIRLTEYFLGNMLKALRLLTPETASDTIDPKYRAWYDDLPVKFSLATAYEIGAKHRLKDGQIRMFIKRNGKLFEKLERGTYEKI